MSANLPIQPRPNIEHEHEPPRRQGLPPVAKIVCGAAFVLSAGLAIPFFFAKSRVPLPAAAVHLPRTAVGGGSPALLIARSSNAATASGATSGGLPPLRLLRNAKKEEEKPVDTLGAIKHAMKAFGLATVIVGATAGTAFAGITLGLGITTLGQFRTVMRSVVRTYFPEMHSQMHSVSDSAAAQYRTEIWERERVEAALEEALAKGGWSAWVEEARKQLERERAVAQRMAEVGR